MAKESQLPTINDQQSHFVREYIRYSNASKAYQIAYEDSNEDSARKSGSRLLTNDDIRAHVDYFKHNLEELLNISKLRVAEEVMKMAFSSMAEYHDRWISRKEFDELSEEAKSCIESVETKSKVIAHKRFEEGSSEPFESDVEMTLEQVKVKLYSKTKAIEILNKMLGYNDPEKLDLGDVGQIAFFQLPSNNRDATPEG